jgi:hypothetical protein
LCLHFFCSICLSCQASLNWAFFAMITVSWRKPEPCFLLYGSGSRLFGLRLCHGSSFASAMASKSLWIGGILILRFSFFAVYLMLYHTLPASWELTIDLSKCLCDHELLPLCPSELAVLWGFVRSFFSCCIFLKLFKKHLQSLGVLLGAASRIRVSCGFPRSLHSRIKVLWSFHVMCWG